MNAIPAIGTPPYPGARFDTTRAYQIQLWQREHPRAVLTMDRNGVQNGRVEESAAVHDVDSQSGVGSAAATSAWFATA